MNREDEGKILGAFLIGGILGIGLALLFAPQSGKKTRKDISKFAGKVGADAKEKVDDVVESIKELTDKVGDKISDTVSKGKELEDGAKKKILKTIEDAQKVIEKQKARLTKLIK